MPKQKPEEVQKELDEQEKEFYGEGTISGSAPDPSSDDDVMSAYDDAVGTEEEEEEEEPQELNIAKEIEDDEEAIREKESPEELLNEDL